MVNAPLLHLRPSPPTPSLAAQRSRSRLFVTPPHPLPQGCSRRASALQLQAASVADGIGVWGRAGGLHGVLQSSGVE